MLLCCLFLLELVFTVLFIRAGFPKATKRGFAFKMCASTVFVLTGLYCAAKVGFSGVSVRILIGLCFGLVGDIFLTLDPFTEGKSKSLKMAMIGVGGVFFLGGHVAYFLAFLLLLREHDAFSPVLFFASLIAVLAAFLIVKTALRLRMKALLIPILVYAAGIGSMFSLALCLAVGVYSAQTLPFAVLLAAPLLFLVSDTSLVIRFFDLKRFDTMTVRAVNLGTYFAAQMLFAIMPLLLLSTL